MTDGQRDRKRKESGYLVLGISDPQALCRVARALSVPKRIEILQLLGANNIMNVGEIAKAIDLPVSSTAMHICALEEAGLIDCEKQPSLRGAVKMCRRQKNEIVFHLDEGAASMPRVLSQQLPLGAYSAAEGIVPSCGLASQSAPIGAYNNPRSFHLPERLGAAVLWFHKGYLEYLFSTLAIDGASIHWLEVSMEACSQAPIQASVWRSALRVSINGVTLGERICTCDSQGRRGTFNPTWWPDIATQYGELLTWRVEVDGTYVNKVRVSDIGLADLALPANERITVRIEAPDEDGNQPGVNLFGSHFGDYNQGINLQIGYSLG